MALRPMVSHRLIRLERCDRTLCRYTTSFTILHANDLHSSFIQ
jgi:hypothetical protein